MLTRKFRAPKLFPVSAIPERNKGLAERMYVVEGDFTGGTPPCAVSLALLATSGSGPFRPRLSRVAESVIRSLSAALIH